MEESRVYQMTCARVPTPQGEFELCLYTNDGDDKEHLAVVKGDVRGKSDVLVRVHSECFTGDVLSSKRCDCGEQLQRAVGMIADAGEGVLIYLRQEGRGIGLLDKLRAYNLQDQGYDTVEANIILGHTADERDYTVAAGILEDLGVHSIRLITNNPNKIKSLRTRGIRVNDRLPISPTVNKENAFYLNTKRQRLNHFFTMEASQEIAAEVPLKNSNDGSD